MVRLIDGKFGRRCSSSWPKGSYGNIECKATVTASTFKTLTARFMNHKTISSSSFGLFSGRTSLTFVPCGRSTKAVVGGRVSHL